MHHKYRSQELASLAEAQKWIGYVRRNRIPDFRATDAILARTYLKTAAYWRDLGMNYVAPTVRKVDRLWP